MKVKGQPPLRDDPYPTELELLCSLATFYNIMGVKDLWTILVPVKREKSLTDLAGQRLAVDLSGWVCQAETTKVTVLNTHTIKVLITGTERIIQNCAWRSH